MFFYWDSTMNNALVTLRVVCPSITVCVTIQPYHRSRSAVQTNGQKLISRQPFKSINVFWTTFWSFPAVKHTAYVNILNFVVRDTIRLAVRNSWLRYTHLLWEGVYATRQRVTVGTRSIDRYVNYIFYMSYSASIFKPSWPTHTNQNVISLSCLSSVFNTFI